jgi:hypothetical protein
MTTTGGNGGDPIRNHGKAIPHPGYSQSLIILYGTPVTGLQGPNGTYISLSISPDSAEPTYPSGEYEFALIYGYSYQGHCYPLDAPRIYMVNKTTKAQASGCGFDGDYFYVDQMPSNATQTQYRQTQYWMWQADKLDETLQLDPMQGFFQELLLDANLPTAKQGGSYRISFVAGHRGGKLTG